MVSLRYFSGFFPHLCCPPVLAACEDPLAVIWSHRTKWHLRGWAAMRQQVWVTCSDLDTSSFLGCCGSSPRTSCPHLHGSQHLVGSPHCGCQCEQGTVSRGLAIPGGHPSATTDLASGSCWFTPRSKTCGLKQQLGKASFPWLQSLAPLLPCLQTKRISPRSSLDMHPAWPQGWSKEHLRKKI